MDAAVLGRAHRFHGRRALNGVYKRGRTIRSSGISLRFLRRPDRRPYRVAVVVSRKVSKSAVTRNRIRRRVYAAIEGAAESSGPDDWGLDMAFTVFDERIADMPADEVRRAVADLLRKAAADTPG